MEIFQKGYEWFFLRYRKSENSKLVKDLIPSYEYLECMTLLKTHFLTSRLDSFS